MKKISDDTILRFRRPTKAQLETLMNEYVEVRLFGGTVLKGVLSKTEDDLRLRIYGKYYYLTGNDWIFKVSHIERIEVL